MRSRAGRFAEFGFWALSPFNLIGFRPLSFVSLLGELWDQEGGCDRLLVALLDLVEVVVCCGICRILSFNLVSPNIGFGGDVVLQYGSHTKKRPDNLVLRPKRCFSQPASWNLTNAKSDRLLVRITTSKIDSDSSKLVWTYDSGILIIELPEELSSPALTVLDSTYTLINHVGKVGMAFRDVKGSAFKLWILSEPGDWIPMRVSTEIFNQDPLVNRTVSFEGGACSTEVSAATS
ncbi:hypothetical protein F2Q70_00014656 [Brassica cretica]|uniref:Uncharacterized protein n=1 Tax=Brassica cretica TaxID=69181 RepID=A0A8S9HQY0_BRACR|nr:hypothetical protein F2Q70_00014656 [Brassica cretica]